MHVVIVDGDVSYPATSGKRLRTLNLMLRLARRHGVAYIGRCDTATVQAREARAFLGDHGIEPILVHHPVPGKKGSAFYVRAAANLFSPLPYCVASHRSQPMREAVEAYASQNDVDLWQFEWAPYIATLDGTSGVRPEARPLRKLVIQHNVESLIWQRYYQAETNPLKRWYIKGQWSKMERFERHALQQASRIVSVSPEDAALMRERFGLANVDVVDNGIDKDYFAGVNGPGDPKQILFLGALDWRPNLDALGLLLDRIFPAVRARVAEARLVIVGRNPSDGLVRRAGVEPGVELHANVADVRPFLASSGVMTVPLRIGGGSRLKILEALACGLPVISTRIGAEGLALTPGVHYLAAEEEEMAQALVRVIRDPEPARTMARHGQKVVRDKYDWDVLADKLERVWEKCLQLEPVRA
jgi:glycosyltransferase involved in cell wall biosynthesis